MTANGLLVITNNNGDLLASEYTENAEEQLHRPAAWPAGA